MKHNTTLLTPDEQAFLHQAFIAWGTLTRLEMGESLSTLSNRLLDNLSKFGVRISTSSRHRQSIQWPPETEQMDNLIHQLHQVKPKWAKAIQWHYTIAGDIRYQAKQLNVAKSTYHEQIQKGRTWIAQQLKYLH